MELLASDSMRLMYALALTAILFAAALAFVRRWSPGDWVRNGADALLITFLGQYLSVGVPGLLRILSPWSIVAAGLSASVALWWFSRPAGPVEIAASGDRPRSVADRWIPVFCFCVLIGFLIALIHGTLYTPPMSIDALVYHFAAPVDWLQRRRIAIFPLWYGPANSYSPLGGSTFIAWHLAPAGSDVVARYVQMPPLALVFLSLILIGRSLGFRDAMSATIALAAVLSRPFISESFLPKDDLYVAAFFIATVAALTPERAAERMGPWRVGAALGLMLAMKYTVLFSVPLLALMLAAPLRARWRWKQWSVAAALIVLLAGPWYLRNLILKGNPLYPVALEIGEVTILPGLFQMRRSPDVATLAGLKSVFLDRYHSLAVQFTDHTLLRASLLVVLAAGWGAAMLLSFRRLARDPVRAICVVGPVFGLTLFLLRALYPEIRFVYPSILLLFLCVGIAIDRIQLRGVRWTAIALLLGISLSTAFARDALISLLPAALMVAAGGMAFCAIEPLMKNRVAYRAAGAGSLGLIGMIILYVQGDAYVRDYHQSTQSSWENAYREAGAWTFVRRQLPADATIAVANTNLFYPLQGERFTHRVICVPTRRDVPNFFHLPPTGRRITGEQMITTMGELMRQDPDAGAWLSRLREADAGYLLIAKGASEAGGAGMMDSPAELALVNERPEAFRLVFDSPLVAVYEIRHGEGRP